MRPALACLPLALLFTYTANVVPTKAQTIDASTTEAAATKPLPLPLNLFDVTPAQPREGLPAPGTLQYYDVGRNTSMTCSIPNPSGKSFVWEKNNIDISKVTEITNRYKLENNNTTLAIRRTNEEDYGNYTCKLGGEQLSWRLHARPYTKLPSTDSSVFEGWELKLTCKLIGKPRVPVKWYYNSHITSFDEEIGRNIDLGVQLEANDHIKLETSDAGIENGQLVINAASRTDAGAYACVPALDDARAQSPHPPAVTVLRVKVFWPSARLEQNNSSKHAICSMMLSVCLFLLYTLWN